MGNRIPANHKLGQKLEGFADFVGRYIAINVIVGFFMKVAGSFLVSYVTYKVFIKPFLGW
ncbi:MAG TPA: hypothetical protein P5136_02650 [Methanofastidiosum sp.]|nr:hypothetical protein [Methanofastidiosum sp.]